MDAVARLWNMVLTLVSSPMTMVVCKLAENTNRLSDGDILHSRLGDALARVGITVLRRSENRWVGPNVQAL